MDQPKEDRLMTHKDIKACPICEKPLRNSGSAFGTDGQIRSCHDCCFLVWPTGIDLQETVICGLPAEKDKVLKAIERARAFYLLGEWEDSRLPFDMPFLVSKLLKKGRVNLGAGPEVKWSVNVTKE